MASLPRAPCSTNAGTSPGTSTETTSTGRSGGGGSARGLREISLDRAGGGAGARSHAEVSEAITRPTEVIHVRARRRISFAI